MPNLFDYATGELSQDAFLAWLANWANDKHAIEDSALNEVAKRFLSELSGDSFRSSDIHSVETRQQFKKTDVVIAVTLKEPKNQRHLIVIEDKTSAGQHGAQLETYKKKIENEVLEGSDFKDYLPHFVYYKTHDHITRPEDLSGFRNFSRAQALNVFEGARGKNIRNNIFRDYVDHLRKMENDSNGYINRSVETWENSQWSGFLKALCERLGNDANFGFVPNASGGFIGAWFGWINFPEMKDGEVIYLQLGGNKNVYPYFDLKLRIASKSKGRTEQLKLYLTPIIEEKLRKSDILFSSKNIRKGRTVAIFNFEGIEIEDTDEKVENLVQEINKILSILKN